MTATVASLLIGFVMAPSVEFHVAVTGDDANAGSATAPFRSIASAQAAVREAAGAGLKGDVAVTIGKGVYELDKPLVFGPGDGGAEGDSVTYRAEARGEVTVSGGRRIAGWRRGEGDLWVADVAGVKEGDRYFRQLVVNGRRAIRARTPNAGATPEYLALAGADLAADRSRYTLTGQPGDVERWGNLADVEAVTLGNWEVTRKLLADVDPASATMVLAPPHAGGHDAIRPAPGRFYFLENAREFLDQPGEWYLDRSTGELAYWPLPGEDMTQAVVVAPALTRLLEITGTPADPVLNLHFEGIHFSDADWAFPDYGFNGIQASFNCTPAEGEKGWGWATWQCTEPAIAWTFARGCGLTDGAMENLGGVGIRLRKGCSDCTVEGNYVHGIGGSGIMVGENLSSFAWGKETVPEVEIPRRNRIANNLVTQCGLDDYGAVGIWVAFTDGTTVAHNEVFDVPYTGVSVGFIWNDTPTICANNLIENNHIHHVMQRLCDGGCIYTLGRQPGTVLRGNWLHDASRAGTAQGAPNNGIFFDEGSRGFTVEGNLIHGTSAEPIRFNQCAYDWHTFTGNQFGGLTIGEGKFGPGLVCDGASSYLEAPEAPELEPATITVAACVKVDGLTEGGDTRRWIVGKSRNEWQDGHYGLCIDGAKVGAYLNIGGGQDNATDAWSADGVLTAGTWHHLAFTYGGEVLRVYCDGLEVASKQIGKARTLGNGPLFIGRRPDGYVTLTGQVDEVRVYDHALAADQVAALAKAEDAEPDGETGLVLREGFDNRSGNDAFAREVRDAAGLEAAYSRLMLPGAG